jgi:hypothetical protein
MTGTFTIMGTSTQWKLDILEYFVAISCMVQENGTNNFCHILITIKIIKNISLLSI